MGGIVCAVVGAKGGSYKTASVAALGHLFAAAGLEVLMIDADPQGNLTRRCGFARPTDPLAAEPLALEGEDATGRLCVLPAGRALEGADEGALLERLLRHAHACDLALIDTPPALGPATRSAMRQAALVVVPCPPGPDALDGLADIAAMARTLSPHARLRALIAAANPRTLLYRRGIKSLREHFPEAVYDCVLPIEAAGGEAAEQRLPVTEYAPGSQSAAAYRVLASLLAADLGLTIAHPEVLHA